VVSTPRVSTGPAPGCRISRDYARRGWATKTGHPNWRPENNASRTCKGLEEGGDRVRTGVGAVKRGREVGNGRVRVCRVPDW